MDLNLSSQLHSVLSFTSLENNIILQGASDYYYILLVVTLMNRVTTCKSVDNSK